MFFVHDFLAAFLFLKQFDRLFKRTGKNFKQNLQLFTLDINLCWENCIYKLCLSQVFIPFFISTEQSLLKCNRLDWEQHASNFSNYFWFSLWSNFIFMSDFLIKELLHLIELNEPCIVGIHFVEQNLDVRFFKFMSSHLLHYIYVLYVFVKPVTSAFLDILEVLVLALFTVTII